MNVGRWFDPVGTDANHRPQVCHAMTNRASLSAAPPAGVRLRSAYSGRLVTMAC